MADDLTVARPYARAAFSFASENDSIKDWQNFLIALSALVKNSDLIQASVIKPREEIVDYVGKILDGFMNENQKNFFQLLLENTRLVQIPEILSEFEKYVEAHNGQITAVVKSAHPLSDSNLNLIREKIKNKYGVTSVLLTNEVDPSLIAGFTVKVGDELFDASTRTKLNRLAVNLRS